MHKVFLTQKKKILCWELVLGVLAGNDFKKLEILPIPSLYIYSLMLFVVDSLYYFQTNSSVHEI